MYLIYVYLRQKKVFFIQKSIKPIAVPWPEMNPAVSNLNLNHKIS